ncbi:MAG TPA: nucleotidyltransferase domain-containing protein [Ktedonobacteraceae bacterium]
MEPTQQQTTANIAQLSEEFLSELVQELDHEQLVGITLGGSYAREEATRYSDLDFACFWREGIKPPPKRFFYHQGRLISVKQTSVAEFRAMLLRPGSAMFVKGARRLLLDKDGSIAQLFHEINNFRIETLQPEADAQNSLWLMFMAEEVHKILKAFQQENEPALAYATAKLVSELAAIATLSRNVQVISDSSYYQQVETAIGADSTWSRYHRVATGLEEGPANIKPLRARALAALRLYRETLALIRSIMKIEQLTVVEQALALIEEAVDQLSFTEEERAWLQSSF